MLVPTPVMLGNKITATHLDAITIIVSTLLNMSGKLLAERSHLSARARANIPDRDI